MSVRGEKPCPSQGKPRDRPRGDSVTVYGEFRVAVNTRHWAQVGNDLDGEWVKRSLEVPVTP
jgi:hypothetical protein